MDVPYLFSYVKVDAPKGAKWKVVLVINTAVGNTMEDMEKIFQEFCKEENIAAQLISAVSTEPDFPSFYYGKETLKKNICEKQTPNQEQNFARELVWCKVDDIEKEGVEHWIPGRLNSDGTIDSVVGVLSDPDSPEDIKQFADCPYGEYIITKKGEKVGGCKNNHVCEVGSNIELVEATVVVRVKNSKAKSFEYTMPVFIDTMVSHNEICKQIEKQFRQYIRCIGEVQYDIEVISYESIMLPFKKDNLGWCKANPDVPNIRHYIFSYRLENDYKVNTLAVLSVNHYLTDFIDVMYEIEKASNSKIVMCESYPQVSDVRGMMMVLID